MILAIDPGKEKCGVALMSENGNVLSRRVVPRQELSLSIIDHVASNRITSIVIGAGHFGSEVETELKKRGLSTEINFVSEKDSTWQAKKLYWQQNPPKGWRRLFPTSFLSPPIPIDGYAAEIIGLRYLKLL
jgi:RNase H-fold protein (predicted Holliday junction resolvase)